MTKPKSCIVCHQVFVPHWNTVTICPLCKQRACPICGEQFDIHSLTRAKIYCSPPCYAEGKRRKGQRPPERPRAIRVPVPCPQCGNITQRLPYEIKHGIRFCDKACYLAYRKAQRINGDSHNYFYMSADWIKLRRRIKHRDKHTCQICRRVFHSHSRSLTVHHKTPRETFPDISDTLHPIADRPSNLIALCNSCHQKVHMGSCDIPVISSEE